MTTRRPPGERTLAFVRATVRHSNDIRDTVVISNGHLPAGHPWHLTGDDTGLLVRVGKDCIKIELDDLLAAVGGAVDPQVDPDFGGPLVRTALRSHVEIGDAEVYGNHQYTVHLEIISDDFGLDGPLRIGLHSHDRVTQIPWRHMQRIKNELVGEDRWALEWFPDEDQLVDEANERHLWVLPVGAEPEKWMAFKQGRQTATAEEARLTGGRQQDYA